ncbi:hypothetical protein HG530_012649 [Fusarium avenaceum]|nr:hypothetical protein HG530_012649 [Fusarium avenaceum]
MINCSEFSTHMLTAQTLAPFDDSLGTLPGNYMLLLNGQVLLSRVPYPLDSPVSLGLFQDLEDMILAKTGDGTSTYFGPVLENEGFVDFLHGDFGKRGRGEIRGGGAVLDGEVHGSGGSIDRMLGDLTLGGVFEGYRS